MNRSFMKSELLMSNRVQFLRKNYDMLLHISNIKGEDISLQQH